MPEADKAGKRTVGEIMSSPVITVPSSETVESAAKLMQLKGVGSVVVIGDWGPSGILTERDLVRIAASGADASKVRVADWMAPDPETVPPDVEVDLALNRLAERGYRHMPVVSNGELVGLVSMRDLMKIAQVQAFGTLAVDAPPGLKGVVVADTRVGDVRGSEGFYHYREYDALDLARSCTLEEVWYLLYEGHLPNRKELKEFKAGAIGLRSVPAEVGELLGSIARIGARFVPLEALRSSLSLLSSAWAFRPWLELSRDELKEQAMHVCAVIPTLTAALHRLNRGLEPIEPDPGMSHAANYLYMCSGGEPTAEHARALEQYLISTVEHGFNASTFTARVVTSTGADLGSAVVAALGSLSGPLHGGAPSRALEMLDAIKEPENAEEWIRAAAKRGDRIMGFGHPVYNTDDPRSELLRSIAEQLGAPRVELAKLIESKVVEILEELKPGRRLYSNVELYASIVMETVGLPESLFIPTFACSRTIGWTAHILEQAADNRIIRPSGRYIGTPAPQPIPRLELRRA